MDEIDRLIGEAKSRITDSPFHSRLSEFEQLLKPSLRLRSEKIAQGKQAVASSRMGGLPDLPSEWQWPRWDGYDHPNQYLKKEPTPLSFICQLNLAELPWRPAGIPETGILYFFFDTLNQPWGFDPKDKEGFRVLYFDGPSDRLTTTSAPEDLIDDCVFASCSLTATPEIMLPDWLDHLDIDEDGDNYQELLDQMIGSAGGVHHRFLGHPQSIQGDMQLECQLVSNGLYCGDPSGYNDPRAESLREGAKDWQLLLQIDSDEENPGWMWGDCGRIYFWIHRDDLIDRAFENAWMCLQCS